MTVSDQIIAVIEALCEKFGIVIDWTSANVLPYIEELAGRFIQYEIWASVAWMVLIPLIAVAFWIVVKVSSKHIDKDYGLDFDELWSWVYTIALVVAIFMTVTSIVVICAQIFDIIACLTIPEKVIIDYLKPTSMS